METISPGALLRRARQRHGLTQHQIAIRARTSQAAISRIERDLVSPTVATLAELLRLMNEELVLDARATESRHDRSLIRDALLLTPEERVQRGVAGRDETAAAAEAAAHPAAGAASLDLAPILETLGRHAVDYVLVGGLAGLAHGSQYPAADAVIAYERSAANRERLAAALADLGALPRDERAGHAAVDADVLAEAGNVTVETAFGPLAALGDLAGAPRYDELRRHGTDVTLFGLSVRVASPDYLIAIGEAAGRPADLLMASEARDIADELHRPQR